MSLSSRAMPVQPKETELVREAGPDLGSLDDLREAWRVTAMDWSKAVQEADVLDEKRKFLFDEICLRLMAGGPGMTATRAEKETRVSDEFQAVCTAMHAAKRRARDLDISQKLAQVAYYELKQRIELSREERRMTR